MAIFSNPLFATYSVYARNASTIRPLYSFQDSAKLYGRNHNILFKLYHDCFLDHYCDGIKLLT